MNSGRRETAYQNKQNIIRSVHHHKKDIFQSGKAQSHGNGTCTIDCAIVRLA
jgi:hypothetical protein